MEQGKRHHCLLLANTEGKNTDGIVFAANQECRLCAVHTGPRYGEVHLPADGTSGCIFAQEAVGHIPAGITVIYEDQATILAHRQEE